MQVQRRLETIAAVVARPAGDPDAPGARGQCKRQACHRQARPLHQGVRGQGGSRFLLNPASGRHAVQGLADSACDFLHEVDCECLRRWRRACERRLFSPI